MSPDSGTIDILNCSQVKRRLSVCHSRHLLKTFVYWKHSLSSAKPLYDVILLNRRHSNEISRQATHSDSQAPVLLRVDFSVLQVRDVCTGNCHDLAFQLTEGSDDARQSDDSRFAFDIM